METAKPEQVFARYEMKYIVTEAQAAALLKENASWLTPDVYPQYALRTIYLDTLTDHWIRTSLARPVFKEKLRFRSYTGFGPENACFLESKNKCNGFVYKRRIIMNGQEMREILDGDVSKLETTQIGRELAYALSLHGRVFPRFLIRYDREAYQGTLDASFRLTFDRDITYRTDAFLTADDREDKRLLSGDQVLLEVKAANALPLPLVKSLASLGIQQSSFSKVGAAYLVSCAPEAPARRPVLYPEALESFTGGELHAV